MMRWVIRTADAVFLRDKGSEGLSSGESVVEIARAPLQTERYDASVKSGIRPATTEELAAAESAAKDAKASQSFDLHLRAVAQVDFEERQKLTVRQGQTLRTAQECVDRARAIYRSLLDA